MTVALMAQRHRRMRFTVFITAALIVFILVGGLVLARSAQLSIARDVERAIGATEVAIEIEVDGRDVTLRSTQPVSNEHRQAAARVAHVASVTVEDGS